MTLFDKEGRYLPYDFSELSENLKHKAKEELNETEDIVSENLRKLKSLIKDKNVPICTDEDFLLWFLRCKKFDIKKSFKQVTDYSFQRHNLMKYYGFMFKDPIMPVLENTICGILPKRDKEGRVIIYLRGRQFSRDICHPDDVIRTMQVLIHFAMTFPASQVCGITLIVDSRFESMEVLNLFISYFRWAIPTVHAFPGRFQKIDLINTNLVIRAFANILRPLVPSKLFKRTTFHGSDSNCLLSFYDAAILPEEFGGTLGPIRELSAKTLLKIEEYIPKLQATNKFYKRPDTISFPGT